MKLLQNLNFNQILPLQKGFCMEKFTKEEWLVGEVNRLSALLEDARVNGQQKQIKFFADQLENALIQLTLVKRNKKYS